jgi:hypothetical protein
MALTGKTIGQLTYLSGVTNDTLFPVELSGDTYHINYSAITDSLMGKVTYSELQNMITSSGLTSGIFYTITDFRTCYDQPNFNSDKNPIMVGNYKDSDVEPIVVLAISSNTISTTAYQPAYPKDRIQYDWTFSATEVTQGVAYGRITERIDEFNNRTDYDHRTILFKRYGYIELSMDSPLQGTVDVTSTSSTQMTVSGTGTNFTSLSVGNYVGFGNITEFKAYEVVSISGDTEMYISGLTSFNSSDILIYNGNLQNDTSYYQNNITTAFTEYYTFDYNDTNINNYVGNYSNLYVWDEPPFILSNNVFKGSNYINNTFGDGCFNNTFDDDCTNNIIGNYFFNNITDDDFDSNVIANYFNNNKITSNFYDNRIGENFQYNYLVQSSFYRNNIGNGFEYNIVDGNNFQNNEIGNGFNYNTILNGQFYKNDIGNGYNNNKTYQNFYGNLITNGFYGNTIYSEFYDNQIRDYFGENTIGISVGVYREFYGNVIGVGFYSNDISGNTYTNIIGEQFENNTIYEQFSDNQIFNEFKGNMIYQSFDTNRTDWGFGSNQISGYCYANVFGPAIDSNDFLGDVYSNTFKGGVFGNTIGNNFSSNNIGFGFSNNTIGENFGYGFGSPQGNNIGNYFYNNTVGEYFYNNSIADNFEDNTIDNYFQRNIVNTAVSGVCLSTGMLYDTTTVNVFKNKNGDNKLSYYDELDVLTIETLTEAPCSGGLNALNIPENDLNFGLVINPSFTITSSDFTDGYPIDTDTTPLGPNGTSGFTNTASQNSLYDGYYGTGLSGTSLSGLTTAYNNLGLSLNDSTGRLWYVTWGPGSSIPSGIVKFGAYNNGENFDIQTIDTSDTNYLTPNNADGTSLVGTFLFPATFTIYYPITDKNTWC